VHLEVCPKALFHKQRAEYAFYQRYFEQAVMARSLKALLTLAVEEAARSGVGPMDALHLAAAHLLKADEFITTERPGKSIYRSTLVKIVYLFG
jgi:predicted nucleic acid-binding protein